jgi:hypothetical protein
MVQVLGLGSDTESSFTYRTQILGLEVCINPDDGAIVSP